MTESKLNDCKIYKKSEIRQYGNESSNINSFNCIQSTSAHLINLRIAMTL